MVGGSTKMLGIVPPPPQPPPPPPLLATSAREQLAHEADVWRDAGEQPAICHSELSVGAGWEWGGGGWWWGGGAALEMAAPSGSLSVGRR